MGEKVAVDEQETLDEFVLRCGLEFEGTAEFIADILGSDDVEEIVDYVDTFEDVFHLETAGMDAIRVKKFYNFIMQERLARGLVEPSSPEEKAAKPLSARSQGSPLSVAPLKKEPTRNAIIEEDVEAQVEKHIVSNPEAPASIIASVNHCTSLAMHCRKREEVSKAIVQMQRAVAICEGREHSHPAVAVEAARARLNLSAAYSRGGRHLEALVAIKDAQRGIANVLEWASECSGEDQAVVAIGEEARMLQCAAKMAEAIELEPFDETDSTAATPSAPVRSASSAQPPKEPRQLYYQAARMAENNLSSSHPLVKLGDSLSSKRDTSAVCANKSGLSGVAPPKTRQAGASIPSMKDSRSGRGRSGIVSLPPISDPSSPTSAVGGGGGASFPSSFGAHRAAVVNSEPAQEFELDEEEEDNAADLAAEAEAKAAAAAAKKARREKAKREAERQRQINPGAPKQDDIFKQFLREVELEKAARSCFAESEKEERRRRLIQTGALAKVETLMLEEEEQKKPLGHIYELKYTRPGHAMICKYLAKNNGSRSDPTLLKESKKSGECPEAVHLKRLGKLLPQPRPPTPIKVKTKEELMKERFSTFNDDIKT